MFEPQHITKETGTELNVATGRILLFICYICCLYTNCNYFQGFVKRNNEIGRINGTWGPFFRISFDLIVHSFVEGTGKQGWSSVLAFDKKPSIDLNKNGELRIFFQKKKYSFTSNIDSNKWYNISIEQKLNYDKVRIKNHNLKKFQNSSLRC